MREAHPEGKAPTIRDRERYATGPHTTPGGATSSRGHDILRLLHGRVATLQPIPVISFCLLFSHMHADLSCIVSMVIIIRLSTLSTVLASTLTRQNFELFLYQ
jgi:hypothetical protein